jgi:CRP-like cAMP-binding protein
MTDSSGKEFEKDFIASKMGQALGEEVCIDLLRRGTMRTYSKNSIIFHENDEAIGMYLLVEGVIKLVRFTIDGREVIIHIAEPYRFIAEAALYLEKFPATAVATENVEMMLIRKEDVFELMDLHPNFLKRIFSAMATWLKRFVDKIDQLTLNDATARVAHFILKSLEPGMDDDEIARESMRIPVKKGELAMMLNMNQATLSRALRRLQDENVLEVKAREFRVLDHLALQKLSLPPLD